MDQLEKDFIPAYKAYKTYPGPQSNQMILDAVKPVMSSAIRTYVGQPTPLINSHARKIVLDAMPLYDPSRASLRAHLNSHLQGLRRFSTQQQQILHIPERVLMDQGHMLRAQNALQDALGRDPTDEELADETGMSPKRLAYIRRAHGGVAEGKIMSTDDENIFLPAVEGEDDGWREFVFSNLSPQDQLIVNHSVGRNGYKRLSAIQLAKKLRVTPAAISQRKAKIQAQLDSRGELGVM